MAVDVVPDGKQGSTPENLVGSDAAVCNRIGSGSMSCGRDEPQDSALVERKIKNLLHRIAESLPHNFEDTSLY
mgnify:CR=1 FL=1